MKNPRDRSVERLKIHLDVESLKKKRQDKKKVLDIRRKRKQKEINVDSNSL
jgi:hypothetical protein